jgi:ATP-dependent helicase/DNAse subunit B
MSFDRAVTYDYGLPGEKLDSVITGFISAAKEDPFSSWLLLPTQRLVLHVTGHLTANNVPFIPTRICTLEGFCKILFEENRTTERFLSKTEAKLLLTRILEDPEIEVPLFRSRDRASSGTVDDLMTFMNVTLTRKVPFPECLQDLESKKSDQLDTIITEYRSRLRKLDLFDGNTILEWTIDFLDRSGSSILGTVFIYGFHEPLPLEQDLFDTIPDHAKRVSIFVPDGMDQNIFRTRAAEGDRPGILPSSDTSSSAYQITGLFSESGTFAAGDFFHVETFPTRYAEVYAIAAGICRLNAGGTPLSDIAVAFPDLRGDLSLIEEVFSDFGIPWNAAVGPRLSRAPVVQFLNGIASLASSGYVREDVIRFIGSPFFHKGPVSGGSSGLDTAEVDLVSRYAGIDGPHPDWMKQLDWLHEQMEDPDRAKNFQGISQDSVKRVRGGMHVLIRDLDSLSGKKRLQDHILAYQQFLGSWDIPDLSGAPDKLLKEREIRNRNKFLTRLQALAGIAWLPADEPISSQDFSRLLSSITEEPDDTARQDDDGVTLLGIRECEHMKFPVVFIGGLTEGVFPSLTTRLPFTNSLENARMGTRSLSGILREVQYYFIAALLSAKSTIYLSAPLANGEKVLLTSAFFERVRMRAGECPWPASTGNPGASGRTAAIDAGAGIRNEKACTVLDLIPDSLNISDLTGRINMERYYRRAECDSVYDGILSGDESISATLAGLYGPDHVWSPTSLETYATCPFAYFLNRVINLKALPEVEPNLSASDRGTAIHNVLNDFYRQWCAAGNKRVSLSTLADATEMILRIANAELDNYSFQSPLWDATKILMLGNPRNGPGYFERFIESETVEADSPLVPSRFEFSFGMGTDGSDDPASSPEPVELASPDGTQRLRIRGRIDRIDLTPEGQFLIYDYKSGRDHPKAKDIEAGTALQLPLYLLAYEQITGSHGIGGGYYKIRRDVERNIVLADTSAKDLLVSRFRPSADFPGTLRHSRECAFAYIDGIRNGRFPLPPEEKCPNEYCDFKRICRFDPYRVLESGEET